MVLEATMILVDNSESSRNGDYVPSRWEAQTDAVNLIFHAKTQANAQSSVGLMSMAGKGPEVLVSPTTDFGKILEGIHRTKIRGTAKLSTGIQIAGLALKHRENKAQKQRIIVFTCSSIGEEEKPLITLAKKMKKINVSIDFIVFGDLDPADTKKISLFNEHIKSTEGSHLAIIPPGPNLLSDTLATTDILAGDGVGPRGDSGLGGDGDSGGAGYEFGMDLSADPELALALRMSMEEEKTRQEKESAKAKAEASKEALEGIPEESQPLLGSKEETSKSSDVAIPDKEDDKKRDEAGQDKMETE